MPTRAIYQTIQQHKGKTAKDLGDGLLLLEAHVLIVMVSNSKLKDCLLRNPAELDR